MFLESPYIGLIMFCRSLVIFQWWYDLINSSFNLFFLTTSLSDFSSLLDQPKLNDGYYDDWDDDNN